VYQSIFFSNNWVHESYFNWVVVYESDCVKILCKSKLYIKRYLILASKIDAFLLHKISELSASPFTAQLILHDFTGHFSSNFFEDLLFEKLGNSERLLNNATFVLDLSATARDLFDSLPGKTRNVIKKAISNDIHVNCIEEQDACESAIDEFIGLSAKAVKKYNLKYPSKSVLMRMIKDKRLKVFSLSHQKYTLSIALVYTSNNKAIYMYGANASNLPSGGGQLLQFKITEFLIENGFDWYDLGGVKKDSPNDSIFNFKKRLGGEFYDLGEEWSLITFKSKLLGFFQRFSK